MILKDLNDKDFTVGDHVIWSTSNGLRVGKVRGIKESTRPYGRKTVRVSLDVINGGGTGTRTRSVDYYGNVFYKFNPETA